ncbi:MAG: GGDEF domain-containing protein [Lachnospiraceae bacterium]|nr:GGDEF domain-containing protein [Lachnospiraceae bacterium]
MQEPSEFSNKIKSFITKDTTVSNESIKVIIVIRILLLSVFLYFILNLALCWNVLDTYGRGLCVVFVCGIAVLFRMSYSLRARTQAWVFAIGMLFFIWYNLKWFGWWIGVQHYLIVILILTFFVGYDRYHIKMILAAGITYLRIGLYYLFHEATPIYEIPSHMKDLLQILNTIAIFWCLSVIAYVFSKGSREIESKLVKYNEQLEKEALTDNLTMLANRRKAKLYSAQVLSDGAYNNFSCCMCDIDFFKRVNDTWGHECGDLVLKKIAEIFKQEMKSPNLPCRWGGEEFLLLFPGSNGDEAYEQLVRIRDEIKSMVVEYEGNEIRITMTFGLTEHSFQSDIEATIQEADEKLYYGKNHGRDQIVF